MKMEGADRCRGKKREDTCESLQLNLIKEQLIFIKSKAIGTFLLLGVRSSRTSKGKSFQKQK